MTNIAYDDQLVQQAKATEIQVFDFYGNLLRFTERKGWEVEYSIYDGERKLFRPKTLKEVVWEEYDTEMGIYVK